MPVSARSDLALANHISSIPADSSFPVLCLLRTSQSVPSVPVAVFDSPLFLTLITLINQLICPYPSVMTS